MRLGIAGVHYGHIGGMVGSARDAANTGIVGLVEADDALYEQYTRESPIPRFGTLEEMLSEASTGFSPIPSTRSSKPAPRPGFTCFSTSRSAAPWRSGTASGAPSRKAASG